MGIDSYCDNATKLIDTQPSKFLINYLKYLNLPFEKTNIIKIINNDLFPIEKCEKETLINLLMQYSTIEYILKYNDNLDDNLIKIINLLQPEKINKKDLFLNYLKIIENILIKFNFFEKIQEICNDFRRKNEVHLEKTYLQIEEKLNNVLNVLKGSLKIRKFYSLIL